MSKNEENKWVVVRFVVKLTYCSTKQKTLGFADNNTAGDNGNDICYGGARLSSVVQSSRPTDQGFSPSSLLIRHVGGGVVQPCMYAGYIRMGELKRGS